MRNQTQSIVQNSAGKDAFPREVPSLRSNFTWTLAGNVIYAACQWGMLSTLAKVGDPSTVGQFTFGLAISAPVFMFTNLQLRAVQATDVHGEYPFADYFTTRLAATIFGLLVVLCSLPLVSDSPRLRLVILLVAISKCFECMSDVIAGFLQREENLKRVAISLTIRGAASVLVFWMLFDRLRDLAWSVAGMAAVWLAVFLFYDVPAARTLLDRGGRFFHLQMSALVRLIIVGLPLGWITTFASLNINTPRYFLQHYLGPADQGIYASLAYLIIGVNLVVSALSQSVTTRLAHAFEKNIKQFISLVIRLSLLGVAIAAAGVPLAFVIGRPILTFLYSSEFAKHLDLLAVFVATCGINTTASFIFCGATSARSFRAQVPIYLAAMLIGIAGSGLLIPRYGLMGAGMSQLASSAALALGGVWVLRSVLRTPEPSSNALIADSGA